MPCIVPTSYTRAGGAAAAAGAGGERGARAEPAVREPDAGAAPLLRHER